MSLDDRQDEKNVDKHFESGLDAEETRDAAASSSRGVEADRARVGIIRDYTKAFGVSSTFQFTLILFVARLDTV